MIVYEPPGPAREIPAIDLAGSVHDAALQRQVVAGNAADEGIAATPLPGSFVINIGQMMERFTCGLSRANLHRVRNNHMSAPRHWVATFFELEPEYRMVPAPTSPGADVPEVPLPNIGEHLEDMARASYGA